MSAVRRAYEHLTLSSPVLPILAAALLAGAWLPGGWTTPVTRWAALGAAGVGAAFVLGSALRSSSDAPPADPGRRGATVAVMIAAAFVSGLALPTRPGDHTGSIPAGRARLEAEVLASRPAGPGGRLARTELRVAHGRRLGDNRPIPPGTRISLWRRSLPIGARIRGLLRLRPSVTYRNPRPHSLGLAAPTPGSNGTASEPSALVVIRQSQGDVAFHRIRAYVRTNLRRSLDPPVVGLAEAMVLGDRGALHRSQQAPVRGAGLSHVLAVSGLHVLVAVGFVVAAIRLLLRWLPGGCDHGTALRIPWIVGALCAPGFALLAGGAPSAWRAAAMASLSWTLRAMSRTPVATQLAAAAILILGALRPAMLCTPGFLLSAGATAAILTGPRIPEDSLSGWLRGMFSVALRTTVATAPIVAGCFDQMPWTGVFANVAVLPLATFLLVPLAIVQGFIGGAVPGADRLGATLFELAARAFFAAAAACDPGPHLTELPPLSDFQSAVLAATAFVLLASRRGRTRVTWGAAALCLLFAAECWLRTAEQPRDRLRITFLDVGQGDAAIVDLPDGRVMLIDAGGPATGRRDPGRQVVLPLLRARRRTEVDVAVITHPHPDHYGGLAAVLQALPVTEVWDTGQGSAEDPRGEVSQLLAQARRRGARIRTPRDLCGRPKRFGRAVVRTLWPCPQYDPALTPNDNSFVLSLEFGKHRALFAGDVEAEAERILVRRGLEHADILKVPHHGSRTSSRPSFLRAVRPAWAIVSAGRSNRFGHPHLDVLERFRSFGTKTLRTDISGGIVLTSDGQTLEASTSL